MEAIERLLKAREAQGVRWGVSVRLTAIALGAVMLPATWITVADMVFTSTLLVVGAAISIYAYRLTVREEALARAGWMCLAFDVFTLCTLPLAWYQGAGGAATSPSFLLKNDFVPVCLMLIAANGLTLRPLYPLVATGASLAVYAGFLAYGWGDPRLQFDWGIRESVLGDKVHPGLLSWRLMTIAFFGGLFWWMARAGHRTLREAVDLEHANAEARRRQGELVMQGRLSALAGLVAGLAHEINSPLGVVRSAVQTMASAGRKLEEGANPRALAALRDNAGTAGEAAGRIDGLVRRLKEFAGLDQAELQELDLKAALERTVELIDQESARRGKRGARLWRRSEAVVPGEGDSSSLLHAGEQCVRSDGRRGDAAAGRRAQRGRRNRDDSRHRPGNGAAGAREAVRDSIRGEGSARGHGDGFGDGALDCGRPRRDDFGGERARTRRFVRDCAARPAPRQGELGRARAERAIGRMGVS